MSQFLVYVLLVLALVVPVLGAIGLRLVSARLSEGQIVRHAAVLFGVAMASVFTLALSNVTHLQVGNLVLLLPLTGRVGDLPLPPNIPVAPLPPLPRDSPPIVDVTATDMVEPDDASPTVVIEVTATVTATATVTPMPGPEPEPTLESEPTPEPTLEPEPTPEPRTYTVQSGDTLSGIAARFNVSVSALLEANGLTSEQGDALRLGQELIIPWTGDR